VTDHTASDPTATGPTASGHAASARPASEPTASDHGAPTRAPATGAPASRGRLLNFGIAVLFGAVYAYYLWDAIRSMIELPAQYKLVGLGRENAPWTLLVAGVVVPVFVYIAALIASARRTTLAGALVFLVGLGAVACLSLSIIALG
jgi:hypothetical protein